MVYNIYSALVVCGSSVLALALVRFRTHQKQKARELHCMKRMLTVVCK
jgi:hypothetical protein